MKFQGNGPTARRLAAWLNKVHVGSLGKYIQPARGMQVLTTGEVGVSLAATAPDEALFILQSALPPESSVSAYVCNHDGDTQGSTSHDVYSTYTTDFYGNGQIVIAHNIMGRWEVVSPGTCVARGNASGAIPKGGSGTVTLGPAIASTSSVEAESELFDVESGALVYLRLVGGVWYIDARACPVDETGGDTGTEDGGSPGAGGGDQDGGTPDTGGGNLDGGPP